MKIDLMAIDEHYCMHPGCTAWDHSALKSGMARNGIAANISGMERFSALLATMRAFQPMVEAMLWERRAGLCLYWHARTSIPQCDHYDRPW